MFNVAQVSIWHGLTTWICHLFVHSRLFLVIFVVHYTVLYKVIYIKPGYVTIRLGEHVTISTRKSFWGSSMSFSRTLLSDHFYFLLINWYLYAWHRKKNSTYFILQNDTMFKVLDIDTVINWQLLNVQTVTNIDIFV